MQRNLAEGLTRKALEHLVLPIISIDEYESKISDKRAIVVGFFVSDEAPAVDLSNFIDRSSLPILDTEVSPNPTEEGYYVTWVEYKRSSEFPSQLIEILEEVENLCNIKKWQFTCPGNSTPIDITIDNIKDKLKLDPNEILEIPDEIEKLEEDIKFWKYATVENINVHENLVILEKHGEKLYLFHDTMKSDVALDPTNRLSEYIQNLIGPAYAVYAAGSGFLVECGDQTKYVEVIN